MDWVRRSYVGVWHLFNDAPTARTRGRYYFSPPGTRHYPGVHLLGSRTWNDGNWRTGQALGESLSQAHTWDDGRVPVVPPFAVRAGSAGCIQLGESFANALAPTAIINGFPAPCYAPPVLAQPDWLLASAIERCTIERIYARILIWMYANDLASIQAFVASWLGTNFTTLWVNETPTYPAIYAIFARDFNIVVLDGTRTFQALALQGWSSLTSPANIGAYGTAQFWQDTTVYVLAQLEAGGFGANKKTLMVGHSYGAAVASILAAQFRVANANLEILILTYGLPKPGDQRLINLMNLCRQVHLQNDTDIVCTLPPDNSVVALLVFIFGPFLLGFWIGWQRVNLPFLIHDDGSITRDQPPDIDLVFWAQLVVQAIAHIDIDVVLGHRMTEYMRRLELNCPDAEWPIDQAQSDALDYEDQTPGELALLSIDWPAKAILRLAGLPVGRAGLRLGGTIHHPDAIRLAGSIELPAGVIDLAPAVELPAGVIDLAPAVELPAGDLRLYGELPPYARLRLASPTPTPVGPGTSCGTAGLIALSSPQTSTLGTMGVDDWWYFDATASTQYTIAFSSVSGSGWAATVYSGPCLSLTFIALLGSLTPSLVFTPGPVRIYIKVSGSLLGPVTYTLTVTSP